MPRRKLTESEKEKMQEARTQAREQKAGALDAVTNNSKFINPKFWKIVPPELFTAIEKAMEQARKSVKRDKIRALERELAELKGE